MTLSKLWKEMKYACISRFIKGVRYGRSHQDSWKNAQMGYMREKRQFARVNDQTSELIDVQFRVEQGSMLELALSTLYANDLNDNHDCRAFHINMQTTRLSWSTAPLPIWTLPLAPWKPLKSGQAIPTYCLM